ncbi:NUDIX hydrolase [Nitratireductor luteus]|uniref:NUDIX hydrolase n=1 Tax=Nitratireductor luteus TaxID=2976980 RepID=UPI002240079C|nr:NUDIX domain-containing protein [Nitratireductor luteus]
MAMLTAEGGAGKTLRMVIHDIHAVSAVMRKEGCFLLVLRGRAPAKDLFAFPGGRMKEGETQEDAVRRELLEETGLEAGEVRYLRKFVIEPEGSGPRFILHAHSAEYCSGEPKAGDDAADAGWYAIEDMRRMPVTQSTLMLAETLLAERRR